MFHAVSSKLPNLVLIGGGHSHCVALANWRRNDPTLGPIANITLITPTEKTIYSGAVPGYLAGLCDRQACELNVGTAFGGNGGNVILDEVVGLDLANQRVICLNHDPIDFDIASLNIGSTPRLPPGAIASDRIIPMKPMAPMLDRLETYVEMVSETCAESRTAHPVSLAIVGGGLGGVEIALSLKARWGEAVEITLIGRGPIAAEQPKPLQQFLIAELQRRSIALQSHTTVETAIEAEDHLILNLSSGNPHRCEVSLWATESTAPDWLRSSGLATNDRGFVVVDKTLRSVSHSTIFASGDMATIQTIPLPKAGVFAVRQGHTLGQNLARQVSQRPLSRFNARSNYLSLISLGDRRAVASYGRSAWVQTPLQILLGQWKRSIDREFVDRINRHV